MKSKFCNCLTQLLGIFFLLVQNGMCAPGDLDTSFGTEGKVVAVLPTDTQGECVIVQPDGKILVGGTGGVFESGAKQSSFIFVRRYTAQGILDEDFGNGGTASLSSDPTTWNNAGTAVLLQSDGKIVALAQHGSMLGLVRFHTNGEKDLAYGSQGVALRELPSPVIASAKIANDDKVVVTGGVGHTFFVARVTADGIMDPEFSDDGIVTFTDELGYLVQDLAIQDDRKIVVTGGANHAGTLNGIFLVRFDVEGGLDSSFSENGYLTHAFTTNGDYANRIVIQPDGKILVSGFSFPTGDYQTDRPFLARFDTDGNFDESFGDSGFVSLRQADEGAFASNELYLQSDGRIVVRHRYYFVYGNGCFFRRYQEDGTWDTDYGTDGSIMISRAWGTVGDTYPRSTLMPDGRMVFVAYDVYYEASTAHTSVALWCYQGDELRMLRPVSDGKGKFSFRVKGPFDAAFDIEWTEDFSGWNKAGSGNLSSSYFDFQEIVSGPTKRFYRIRRKD